jgi:hypothetical protein
VSILLLSVILHRYFGRVPVIAVGTLRDRDDLSVYKANLFFNPVLIII